MADVSTLLGCEVKRSNYRILGLVGRGQFGRVYCALDRQTGEFVALKALDPAAFPTNQFLRELRFLVTLQHSNIVMCQAIEHLRGKRFLVMDYCEG
ncbi:protein kinase, partial [Pseudanabaenaceae cyanobacterium LEGE 13415]|nr:protein kinase [Pseudanabaenaceae cyanobacterium LEGE 13415]